MRVLLAALLGCIVSQCLSAPVNPQPNIPTVEEGTDPMDENFLALEYKKYLEEVVQVLESDEAFKAELDKMQEDGDKDLANGQIAHYLQFASKNTRTKLDELKRLEVRRLRDLHKKLVRETAEEVRAGRRPPVKDLPTVDREHLDHENPHTFEIEDLKKLIQKTTSDLSELDKKRKEEFKRYEMTKEHEYREQLKHASDKEEADKIKQLHEEREKKHKEHPKVNHPVNKEQLEEVWQEEDHMEPEQFNPKSFFMLHDIDGDGYLNVPEIEALFQKELDKIYNSSNPEEDDMVERDEEMNRMREHVFTEIDKDRDGLVSFDEFMESTKTEDFEKSEEWDTLDDEKLFDEKEFEDFEKAIAEQEAALKQKPRNEFRQNQEQLNQQLNENVPEAPANPPQPVEEVQPENPPQPVDNQPQQPPIPVENVPDAPANNDNN